MKRKHMRWAVTDEAAVMMEKVMEQKAKAKIGVEQ